MENNASKSKLNKQFKQALECFKNGDIKKAEEYYRDIHRVAPQHPEALRFIGLCRQRLGYPREAVEWMNKALTLMPTQPVFHFEMALIFKELNDEKNTLLALNNALKLKPDYVEALYQLGLLFYSRQDWPRAEATYRQILHYQPNHAPALNGLATVLQYQEQREAAISLYNQAIALMPDYVEAWNNLGNVLKENEQLKEAEKAFNQALHYKPDYAEAHANLADVLRLQDRSREALAVCRKALELKTELPGALVNLAAVLQNLKRIGEALRIYQQIIQKKSVYTREEQGQIYYNLGIIYAYHLKKSHYKAVACLRAALALKPESPHALGSLLHSLQHLCDWQELPDIIHRIKNLIINNQAESILPFVTLLIPLSPREHQQNSRQWAAREFKPFISMKLPDKAISPRPARPRLRVGFMSADFRHHPAAYLLVGVFEKLNKNKFEIIAYSSSGEDSSAIRERIKKPFEQFNDLAELSPHETLSRIREDELDILVDLNGYTQDGRTSILAARLAPIQVQQIGYPGTLGASDSIDYIIADPYVIPEEYFPYYDEKVVWLPDMYMPRDNLQSISELPTRAEAGLPEDGFIFCSLNQPSKIFSTVFDVWMNLLKQVPNSFLWLVSGEQQKNLCAEAEKRGIDPQRLCFAPRIQSIPDHLARLSLADLYLDTFPYNGHTTMGDALWAGVPAITYSGETFTSRVGGSLLKAAGLEEFITTNLKDYEALALALALANNPARLASIRAHLAEQRDNLPLFDTARFTRHLERAYQLIWEPFEQGLSPKHIAVPILSSKK